MARSNRAVALARAASLALRVARSDALERPYFLGGSVNVRESSEASTAGANCLIHSFWSGEEVRLSNRQPVRDKSFLFTNRPVAGFT